MDLPGRGWVGGGENGKMVICEWAVVRLAGRVGWGVWLMQISLARKRGPETRESGGQEVGNGGPSFKCGFYSVSPKEVLNVPEPWGGGCPNEISRV